jgi:hypothetical protein
VTARAGFFPSKPQSLAGSDVPAAMVAGMYNEPMLFSVTTAFVDFWSVLWSNWELV